MVDPHFLFMFYWHISRISNRSKVIQHFQFSWEIPIPCHFGGDFCRMPQSLLLLGMLLVGHISIFVVKSVRRSGSKRLNTKAHHLLNFGVPSTPWWVEVDSKCLMPLNPVICTATLIPKLPPCKLPLSMLNRHRTRRLHLAAASHNFGLLASVTSSQQSAHSRTSSAWVTH